MINYINPSEILQKLIRFDTTNPPGNEAECIRYVSSLLGEAGIKSKIIGKCPSRQNLIAVLKGMGASPPLLMYGHADVVTTENQIWKHPPFEGTIQDGYVWGRGALDMKGPIAMMLAALINAKKADLVPRGDIIFTMVCDEEEEGEYGASFLVNEFGDIYKGVRHAIGEIGGFTMHMGNKKFYPIMVSEKQKCSVKAVVRGASGHGSIPVRNSAIEKLGRILTILNTRRLPVHITPTTKLMLETIAGHMPFVERTLLKQLLNPAFTNVILDVLGEKASFFDPILHNTVNTTILYGGNKINVVPSEAAVELDGRLLPGYGPEDMIRELKGLVGDEVEFEVTRFVPGLKEADMGLFKDLGDIICQFVDSDAIPVTFMVSGCTDARYFNKLGIQTYGFTPMILKKDEKFSSLIHGADERIHVDSLRMGANAIYELIKRYR